MPDKYTLGRSMLMSQLRESADEIESPTIDVGIEVNYISITVDIEGVDQLKVMNKLLYPVGKTDYRTTHYATRGVYTLKIDVKIKDNQTVKFQLAPCNSKTPYLRIDWDPSKVDMETFIKWLKDVFGNDYVRKILLNSLVSKISANVVIFTTKFDCFIFLPYSLQSSIEWEEIGSRIIKQTIGNNKCGPYITLSNTSTVRQKNKYSTTDYRMHTLTVILKSTKSTIMGAYSMLVGVFNSLEFYSTQIIYDEILDPAIIEILVSNGMNVGFYQFDLSKRYTLKDYFMQYKEDNIDTSENSVRAAWKAAFGSFNGQEFQVFGYYKPCKLSLIK